jgi:hypothetical protein
MTKLINILSNILIEAKRIQIDPEITSQLELLTNIIYKKKLKGINKIIPVGNIPLKISDGSTGNAEVIINPSLRDMAITDNTSKDRLDPNAFVIYINPNRISNKKLIYQTLFHELMHATDPVFSTKFSEKLFSTYDTRVDEKYWAHQIEFRASTNEFLEGLVREFNIRKSRLKNKENIVLLIKSANNILSYFASGKKLTKLSFNILQEMGDDEHINNIYQKVLRNIPVEFPSVIELLPEKKGIPPYLEALELIKVNDKEVWAKFLSMLYTTIEEIKQNLQKSI